jgi:oligopeptidase B
MTPQPPVAARRPHVVESPHGGREDPYYWLRDDRREDADVLAYLNAENDYADAMLAPAAALQEQLYQEIVSRIQQDDSSVPYLRKGYWYYSRFVTGGDYPVHARRKGSLDAPEELLLDENLLAAGHGYFNVGDYTVSPDNRLLAWTEDSVGRRQYVVRVRDLATGELLPDRVENVEPDLEWTADSRRLLYVAKDPVTLLGDKVRCHVLGEDPASDRLLYAQPDDSFYTSVGKTKDERYLIIGSTSTVSTEVQVARSDDPALAFRVLLPRERDHE